MSSLSCPKAGGALFGSRRSHRAIPTGYSGYLGYPTYFFGQTLLKKTIGTLEETKIIAMFA